MDEAHAGVGEAVRFDLDDGHSAFAGEQPDVGDVGPGVGPHEDLPRDAAQQHPGGLADAGLDEVEVVDALGGGAATDGLPAGPVGRAVGRAVPRQVLGDPYGDVAEPGAHGVEEDGGHVVAG